MRESLSVLFLYRTMPGRVILRLLVQPGVSRAAGALLSSRISAWLVPCYIRKYQIDMDGIAVPKGGFPSFQAFFIRKRKNAFLAERLPGQLLSPCDGFLSCVPIGKDTVLRIKNTEFSLQRLLRDRRLAERFRGGCALIFRLTPANYHRYCYAADGGVACARKIPGKLHCVRPAALETLPVFVQNSREYQVIRTDDFGWMVQMEIGALLVGKIQNYAQFSDACSAKPNEAPDQTRADKNPDQEWADIAPDQTQAGRDSCRMRTGKPVCRVRAGQEKGYFEFGGSTIVLLLRKGAIRFEKGLYGRTNEGGEIPVRMGECVAHKAGFSSSPVHNMI